MSDIVERLRSIPGTGLPADAADEIERLRMENVILFGDVEAAQQDAARYRWLRSMARGDMYDKGVDLNWYEADPEALDAAIDREMKVSGG